MTMLRKTLLIFALLLIPALAGMAAEQAPQSKLNPAKAEAAKKFPVIVLYSVSWCPHCRAAKEYLTENNIPFSNLDVELDSKAMDDLTLKYESKGVPVLVIGSGANEVVMKGFTPELFQDSLKKALLKK
jgi:glutaredoxin 3